VEREISLRVLVFRKTLIDPWEHKTQQRVAQIGEAKATMLTWFSKTLGDGMMAYESIQQIEEVFEPLYEAAGEPLDMAVFTRHDSEGRLHCEVTAYFSPAAAKVARIFDAEPCERPLHRGLDLIAGDPHCWSVIFPEDKVL